MFEQVSLRHLSELSTTSDHWLEGISRKNFGQHDREGKSRWHRQAESKTKVTKRAEQSFSFRPLRSFRRFRYSLFSLGFRHEEIVTVFEPPSILASVGSSPPHASPPCPKP